ncbi:MAG: tRNA lysidine(34) synthetase TilS [bacterium]|nr:tRNA lysidine(34) synthetase TilS [bacterium]
MPEEILKNFLDKYDLKNKTIIVGFSGGYDSMCLLDMLYRIKQSDGYEEMNVIAAHFNHNWRGEESLREQEVCRMFAASKGFEFYTRMASAVLKKNENEARIARYEFFEEAYEEFDADAIFTAHNKDDNAETVLYRAIKGTGIVGLKGISENRGYFYRPLLKVSRAEILKYCQKYNLSPNNDSSNSDTSYKRNFLRLKIMPALENVNPSVKDALNTLAEIATGENEIIEEYLSKFRNDVLGEDSINPQIYSKLLKPAKMRFLHEFIQKLDLDYDYKKIKELYTFIEENITKRNGKTLSLASAMWLYVDEKTIEVIPKRKSSIVEELPCEVQINGEGEYVYNDKTIVLKKFVENEIFVFPPSTSMYAYIDLTDIKPPYQLRTRRDGDVIVPFGMKGSMKLKKYMNAKGVARHMRDSFILLAKDEEVLWVAGVGLSNKIGVIKSPTHVIEIKQD